LIKDAVAYRDIVQLAERGRADAQFALAKMYETGNSAVTRDLVSAYVLYYVADKKGLSDATIHLRSLESTMSAECRREAKAVIRSLEAQDTLKQPMKKQEKTA